MPAGGGSPWQAQPARPQRVRRSWIEPGSTSAERAILASSLAIARLVALRGSSLIGAV